MDPHLYTPPALDQTYWLVMLWIAVAVILSVWYLVMEDDAPTPS